MNKSGVTEQVLPLPKGGGATSGIGETFTPDLHTGTGTLTVPIAIPPGRNGFHPQLNLTYSSGLGDGPFGLGWSIGVPNISRDTRNGVPQYRDDDECVLSGFESLVAIGPGPDGVVRYRPRTESIFARIERHRGPQEDWWQVRGRDGIVSRYGTAGATTADSAIVRNPGDASQIASWQLTETVDPCGNRIEYAYARESSAPGRSEPFDQLYLETIRYADFGSRQQPRFLVSVTFVYDARPDPFSAYRAGFEVRTTRRCVRIEVRTHADADRLTRVYRLLYRDQLESGAAPAARSLLARIEVEGVDGDARELLPPIDFGYTAFDPGGRRYTPLAGSGGLPERSLAHPDFELADLFGRGLPDIVQIGDQRRFWKNRGDGRFDAPRPLSTLADVRLGAPGVTLADFDGDGHVDLMVSTPAVSGFVPLTAAASPVDAPRRVPAFIAENAVAPFAFDDPEVRLVDLDGDGRIDALRTGADLELFFHEPGKGWARTERRSRGDLARFPDVRFSDPRVKLADMTGDGLQDIVLVTGNRIDYWPSKGHGRWGARLTMSGPLRFPDARAYGGTGFDPRRLLLGDVDGDGAADLVYVESGRVTIWLNQAGNRWSDPMVVHGTPWMADADAVRLADLFGHGTAGILWSYDRGAVADSHYKFLDLTGGVKPYLLDSRVNNAGARTEIEYAPSTRFRLDDDVRPDTRWPGQLPFPVQVVSRVRSIDQLSNGILTSEFRYHLGYWDGEEREFRGFGLVEHLDSELVSETAFSPPVLTRTWFHQGLVRSVDGEWIEPDPPLIWPESPPAFPQNERVELAEVRQRAAQAGDGSAARQALRALRGTTIRTEIYALDGSPLRERPYSVTEQLFDVREIDPPGAQSPRRRRVFFPMHIAGSTSQWERGSEPMTRLTFVGGYDEYGLPRWTTTIGVPRGRNPYEAIATPASPYLCTHSITDYARRDDASGLMADRVCRAATYEGTNDGRETVFALRDRCAAAPSALPLVSYLHSFYDGEPFVGLPLGQLGTFGLVSRTETLAFTDAFAATLYDASDPKSVWSGPAYLTSGASTPWPAEYPQAFRETLPPLAGYLQYGAGDIEGCPAGFFVQTERHRYDVHDSPADGRGLARASRDPFGAESAVDYDAYDLLPVRFTDPAGLTRTVTHDYRVLQPNAVTDANGSATVTEFSPAGYVVAKYVRGRNGEGDVSSPTIRMVYDLRAFADRGAPPSVRTIRRIHYESSADVPPDERDRTIEAVDYSDGFGRLLQRRMQGPAIVFGDERLGDAGLSLDQSAPTMAPAARESSPGQAPHVVVSGWTVYDNKGRIVEKHETFFSSGWDYEPQAHAPEGRTWRMYYDALGRLARTVNPDASEHRLIFGAPTDPAEPDVCTPTPWEAWTYDANDNAGRTHGQAAVAYEPHWNTPSSVVVDALGRAIESIERGGVDPSTWRTTRSTYDIKGNRLTVTDALGRVAFAYVYDLRGQMWRQDAIDAGRRDTVVDAGGLPIEGRDSKGAVTLMAADALRRPSRLWARDAATGAVTLRQRLEYGDAGRADQPAAERDAARSHNLLGRLTRQHDEAGALTIDDYDLGGGVASSTRRVIADATLAAPFAGADAAGWRITPFQVDWEPSGGGSLDALETAWLDPFAYTTSTSYDSLGRVTRMRLPQDVEGQRREVVPSYDAAGQLERTLLGAAVIVDRVAYDARGRAALMVYGNGTMSRRAYDRDSSQVTRVRAERCVPSGSTYAPAGGVLQDCAYAYDLVGNVLTMTSVLEGCGVANNPDAATAAPWVASKLAAGDALIQRFTHDPFYRIVSASGRETGAAQDPAPWGDTARAADPTAARLYEDRFVYDPAGSLLRIEHRTGGGASVRVFAVEAGTNRLQTATVGQIDVAYAFDANGNLTSETASRRFEWTHRDGLNVFRTQVDGSEPSVYAQYLYDATGARVKKFVRKQGGLLETCHYIGGVFEHRRTGGVENNEVHVRAGAGVAAHVRVGPALAGDASPAIRFVVADHLGSAQVLADANGAAINREEFTAFGETSFGTYARKRYRFTGSERDEESGLYQHGVRCYAPWLARWASCDPAGASGGLNLFAYADNSPMRLVDTDGRSPAIPAEGLPVANMEKGLTLLDQLNTAQGAKGSTEWVLAGKGGQYRVFQGAESLTGTVPKGFTAVAHTHPPGALITAEDVATTTGMGVDVGGVRTHLVSRGGGKWSVLEAPKSGPVTLTDIELATGRVTSTGELMRVGVGPTLTPHKFDTFRHVNQPSPFRSEATLAEALEGSKPIGRTLGTAAGVAGGGGGSLGGGASITAETGEAAEVGGLAKTLSGAGKVMKFGGDVVMGAFVFRRAFLAGYYLRERRGWEAAKQIPLLAKDLILDPILMMADMRQRQIDAIRAMYPNDPYGPDAERMLKYSCLTGGPSCHW